MMNSSAQVSGGAMFQVSMRGLAGLWGVAGGLNAQCLRRNRFLRVNSWDSKRRFEGIWTDVSCIFDYKLAFISILENWFSILEHGD